MEPEFQRALIIVLIAGTGIAAVGTVALIFIFRAFGSKEAGRSWHMGLIAALLAFVFLCCVALFALSYVGD